VVVAAAIVIDNRVMTRTMLLGLVLLVPCSAHAQLTVVSTEAHPATASTPASTTLVVNGELGAATAMLSANADAQLREAAPQVYAPIDLGIVRYHDTSTVVDSITWRRASDTELGVTVRAHVRAHQEHRTLTLTWVGDGVVNLANVTLEARVRVEFTPSGGVHLVVLGDTMSVQPQLTGLSSLGEQAVPLNGQQLGDRTVDTNPLASHHLRGTAVQITGVDGTVAHATITAVPAT
jgi:hypothetical protein